MTSITDGPDTAEEKSPSVTLAEDDPSQPNNVFYVLRRFRGNAASPYKTERTPANGYRSPRAPGPANPCHSCGGTEHFARTCPRLTIGAPTSLTHANMTTPQQMTSDLRELRDKHMADDEPPGSPPHIPDQGSYFLPIMVISSVYAATQSTLATSIMDTCTPGDIVGDKWLRLHPQAIIGTMRPPTTRHALGNDVPDSIGRIILRLTTISTTGKAAILKLSSVHVLRHNSGPLLVGLESHQRLGMIVHTPRSRIYIKKTTTAINCPVQHGHFTLPSRSQPTKVSTYYTRAELSLAHRPFGHASLAASLGAFPPHTFSTEDKRILHDVAQSCVPCPTHVHLPRKLKHALILRPRTFN